MRRPLRERQTTSSRQLEIVYDKQITPLRRCTTKRHTSTLPGALKSAYRNDLHRMPVWLIVDTLNEHWTKHMLDATEPATPNLRVARRVLSEWPNIWDPVRVLLNNDEYRRRAEQQLARLAAALNVRGGTLEDALDGYIEMTIDTLRLQAEYYRTGRFSYLDESPGDTLHNDGSLMLGRYLPGLFLATLFWPNHNEKSNFFEQQFLPELAPKSLILDVGTGPGTYGLILLNHGHRVVFNDLSPFSEQFVQDIAHPSEPVFHVGSFLDLDVSSQYDAIVFSEVVEHLPSPRQGMAKLHELCRPSASVFFSTATNAAFYDHTIIFETVTEIRELVREFGFQIKSEQEVVATRGPAGRDVVDYNAVLTKLG